MNEKNYEYLKDQLKYSGFGETKNEELKEKMEKGSPDFKIFHQSAVGKDQLVSTFHFDKSKQSDLYFFNRFELSMKQEQSQEISRQTFNHNITLKEGYNLLKGRAVHKSLINREGEHYKAWLQLDFKDKADNGNYKINQYHENYGYDIEKELAKYPIKELSNTDKKEMLLRSLERGNRQAVTLQQDGNEQRIFIEADPKYKSLNIYDQHMKPMRSQELESHKELENKPEMKMEQKHEPALKKENKQVKQRKAKQKSNDQGRSI